MTEKTKTKSRFKTQQHQTEKAKEALELITVVYNGKEYSVKFPNNAEKAKPACGVRSICTLATSQITIYTAQVLPEEI